MFSLASHSGLLRAEGGFVNERCAVVRQLDGSLRELRIQAIGDRLSLPFRADHLIRRDHAPVIQRDRLAKLQFPVEWTSRNSQLDSFLQVEYPRPVLLLQTPAEAEDRVVEGKRIDIKLVFIQNASAKAA